MALHLKHVNGGQIRYKERSKGHFGERFWLPGPAGCAFGRSSHELPPGPSVSFGQRATSSAFFSFHPPWMRNCHLCLKVFVPFHFICNIVSYWSCFQSPDKHVKKKTFHWIKCFGALKGLMLNGRERKLWRHWLLVLGLQALTAPPLSRSPRFNE